VVLPLALRESEYTLPAWEVGEIKPEFAYHLRIQPTGVGSSLGMEAMPGASEWPPPLVVERPAVIAIAVWAWDAQVLPRVVVRTRFRWLARWPGWNRAGTVVAIGAGRIRGRAIPCIPTGWSASPATQGMR